MPHLDTLLDRERAGEAIDFLFFWGHRPAADGRVGASCLSQWWRSGFDVDGEHYRTAEHYMMAAKARLFGDEDIARAVLAADGPDQAKSLGRKVRGFDDARWREHRYDVVVRANEAKFGQHPALAAYLRGTGDAVLVEASPVDSIWGIGLTATSPDARRPSSWPGLNLLGFALVDVRARLR
ncbi:NADAR family protein [Actinokineospora sp. NBRC 105648]|uniref:NADAR family protein n=1 Tax=Actinokineospora sp. NBRC 105648 TaxID=3032206 RepID=UPI00255768C7|nr:NADAR family protein [Actinokineospora sp. NBRC 105648]